MSVKRMLALVVIIALLVAGSTVVAAACVKTCCCHYCDECWGGLYGWGDFLKICSDSSCGSYYWTCEEYELCFGGGVPHIFLCPNSSCHYWTQCGIGCYKSIRAVAPLQ